MRSRGLAKFLSVIVLAAIIAYIAFFGINAGNYSIKPVQKSIRLGLDLQGGVYVLEQAEGNVTQDAMTRAISIIRNRVDSLGVSQPLIVQQGPNRIRIEIPGVNDPDQVISFLGQTAQLKFVGPDGKVILTGADVKNSKAVYQTDQTGVQQPVVTLELNSKGAKAFADATGKFVGKQIAIVLDNKTISAPVVQEQITGGEAVINGMKDFTEAKNLANLIRGGALPVTLKQVEYSSVGATLGPSALKASEEAGLYGLVIVLLFMIAFYRLPGLIADIALGIYILINFIVYALLHVTLDLPGIAGMLLSIGMAVDANIIIFERMKEEMRAGKSIRASLDAGFKKAFVAVFDSNITTLIAAFVLFFMGAGTVKGFALTLIIGVISSMFTAITVSRFLLKSVVDTEFTKNIRVYGA
ncbi:protein-export membrane protein SecD [Thermoanaerobacterium thermosaccharolyticum]|uniref:protein translocase subunit SecD n=1 Tax=Thermoanaerobacterium thermosaccharolyticum TaxID=1517 RepID=UPI000C0A291D|nr:protein translocase subunit SecD [Thermoanaerobacterium thermosaccharolyticum]PHO06972.1 protein-export membrane protein SecD [Thermoanaerobacterium thermosaccharolyticum]